GQRVTRGLVVRPQHLPMVVGERAHPEQRGLEVGRRRSCGWTHRIASEGRTNVLFSRTGGIFPPRREPGKRRRDNPRGNLLSQFLDGTSINGTRITTFASTRTGTVGAPANLASSVPQASPR